MFLQCSGNVNNTPKGSAFGSVTKPFALQSQLQSGRSARRPPKEYFDLNSGVVVRAFPDGLLEKATMLPGSDGFMEGIFEDGKIFKTDMPNLLGEQQHTLETNSALRAQAKAEAKAATEAADQAKVDAAKATKGLVKPKSHLAPDHW